MFLPFFLHIESFGTDFLVPYGDISPLTPADYFCLSEKNLGSLQYCVGNCFLMSVIQITLSCKADVSWRHPEFTWKHLNLWNGESWSSSSNSQQGLFPPIGFQVEQDYCLIDTTIPCLLSCKICMGSCWKGWFCSFSSQICMAVQWVWLSQLKTHLFFFLRLVSSQVSPWSNSLPGCANASLAMQGWPWVEGAMGITPPVRGCTQVR